MPVATAREVLDFWFSDEMKAAWFVKNPEIDREIERRFLSTHELAHQGGLENWNETAHQALALTIVLDQFPRNIFRNSPRSFASDPMALATAKKALDRKFDCSVSRSERSFFYLPLMHSENLDDQKRCVEIYQGLGNENSLGFAIRHHDIIEKFGRFPHRNAVLGRQTTAEEQAFLKDNPGF